MPLLQQAKNAAYNLLGNTASFLKNTIYFEGALSAAILWTVGGHYSSSINQAAHHYRANPQADPVTDFSLPIDVAVNIIFVASYAILPQWFFRTFWFNDIPKNSSDDSSKTNVEKYRFTSRLFYYLPKLIILMQAVNYSATMYQLHTADLPEEQRDLIKGDMFFILIHTLGTYFQARRYKDQAELKNLLSATKTMADEITSRVNNLPDNAIKAEVIEDTFENLNVCMIKLTLTKPDHYAEVSRYLKQAMINQNLNWPVMSENNTNSNKEIYIVPFLTQKANLNQCLQNIFNNDLRSIAHTGVPNLPEAPATRRRFTERNPVNDPIIIGEGPQNNRGCVLQ